MTTARRTAFATDFDGTLYFHHGADFADEGAEGYRPEDIAAIRAYQEAGGLFGICTGRAIGMLENQYYDLFQPDFVIALTGACIYGKAGSAEDTLWEETVSVEVLREVCDRYASATRMVILCSGNDYYVLQGDADFPFKRVSSVEELPSPHYGMSLEFESGQDELAGRIAAEINRDFGDELAAFQNLASVDIVAAGCSKGEGVRRVKRELEVDLIGGMGDSFNDLTMLEAADVSYTFAHAPAELQDAADHIVSGIAEALADLQRR